VLHLTLLG